MQNLIPAFVVFFVLGCNNDETRLASINNIAYEYMFSELSISKDTFLVHHIFIKNIDKMPDFIKDVSSFATLFTAASVKNYSWFELPLADFALIDLLFFSNEKIKEHLNIFFTDLEIKISGE